MKNTNQYQKGIRTNIINLICSVIFASNCINLVDDSLSLIGTLFGLRIENQCIRQSWTTTEKLLYVQENKNVQTN